MVTDFIGEQMLIFNLNIISIFLAYFPHTFPRLYQRILQMFSLKSDQMRQPKQSNQEHSIWVWTLSWLHVDFESLVI